MTSASATGFWPTVLLLLKTARVRARGRVRHQAKLLKQRRAYSFGAFSLIITLIFMLMIQGFAALAVITAVNAGQYEEAHRRGLLVVDRWFYDHAPAMQAAPDQVFEDGYDPYVSEAARIVHDHGGNAENLARDLRQAVVASGAARLIPLDEATPGPSALGRSGAITGMLGGLVVLWWMAMLICQGEGLELDIQRRRHPMWEWLLSHPVQPGAVFLADMLAPLVASPSYWGAPLFVGILYWVAQNVFAGAAAALLIGVPLTVALSCAGKALEIGALLRLSPRSRGAVIGMIGWFGYASLVGLFLMSTGIEKIVPALSGPLAAMARTIGPAPRAFFGLFMGLGADGSLSVLRGMLFAWVLSALMIGWAVLFSARSIRRGLAGAFPADKLPARRPGKTQFGRQPLYRKEFLWFVRDRSAIVQTILIPLTIAGVQLFNLRAVLAHAGDAWNTLCGAAIFFGTYFLWVLGPKSLSSEGPALWITLTWPQGLESILKAKAWLWTMIASGLVLLVLLSGCWLFPQDAWKIALVAVAWFVFARSMAEKAVTLVTVASETGETPKVSQGRRWGASLGMLSFAIGVATQQWQLAVVGIVFSWITAAAMWQNLRAHLPYLYDPWSEVLPAPPTLMHAMISISVLIECVSVISAIAAATGGMETVAAIRGLAYGLCAVVVAIGVVRFLRGRDVPLGTVWNWDRLPLRNPLLDPWLAVGLGGGAVLGLAAHGYLAIVRLIPAVETMMRQSQAQMQSIPGMAQSYAVIAIWMAPLAEEFLFRGLLYRALDREWGGWKAVVGAAAFFAIYHPALSWAPVAVLGAANCVLFRRSGSLAPCVVLHMTYNAIVLGWT